MVRGAHCRLTPKAVAPSPWLLSQTTSSATGVRRADAFIEGESSRRPNLVIRLQQAAEGDSASSTRTCLPDSAVQQAADLGERIGHVMALRSTLTPSIPVAHRRQRWRRNQTQRRSRLGRPRRVDASALFNGHIELTDVRLAPPSANLQRTRLMRRAPVCRRWSPPESR